MIRRVATALGVGLTAAAVVVSLAGCGLRGGRDEPVSPAAGSSNSASNTASEASTATEEVSLDLDADLDAVDAELSQADSDISAGTDAEVKEEK